MAARTAAGGVDIVAADLDLDKEEDGDESEAMKVDAQAAGGEDLNVEGSGANTVTTKQCAFVEIGLCGASGNGQELRELDSCGHEFHTDCLDRALLVAGYDINGARNGGSMLSVRCPKCRVVNAFTPASTPAHVDMVETASVDISAC